MTPNQAHIPAVTRRGLSRDELAQHPRADRRLPDHGVLLMSVTADLRVMVMNYGERQPGAEDVLLKLSRPVLGLSELDTTNGDAHFSESGRLLVLALPFEVIAIRCEDMHARHFALPNRTMLMSATWNGDQLLVRWLPYARPASETVTLGPLSWEAIAATWAAGLGSQR
jgi:hypothetical protein